MLLETPRALQEASGHAESDNLAKSDLADLKNILTSPDFENRFVVTQTGEQQSSLDQLVSSVVDSTIASDKKTWFDRADQLATEALAATHNVTSLDEARKLGKTFGKARGEAMDRVKTEVRSKVLENPTEEIQKATAILEKAQSEKRAEFERMQRELEERQDDPTLAEALDVWGKSPDSKGERGAGGKGFNAGVIHYFEYLGDKAKSGRYKFSKSHASIQSFIDYSMRLKNLLSNPDPASNHEILNASLIGDEGGQQRLFLLTQQQQLIVAFRRAQEEGLRVITDIPGQREKDYSRRVSEELNGNPIKEEGRLNCLGAHRNELPLPAKHQ